MQQLDTNTSNTPEYRQRLSHSTGELPPLANRTVKKHKSTDCFLVSDIEDLRSQLDTNTKLCGVHKIALCRCAQSKHYPLCDSTHQVFNRETNSDIQPLLIQIVETKKDNMGNTDIFEGELSQPKVKRKLRKSVGADRTVLDGATRDETKILQTTNTIEEKPNNFNQASEKPKHKGKLSYVY